MDVLKKIKASTLMETLIATVLIVVVFMVASMVINNIFYSTIKNNTTNIEAELNELQYLYSNEKLKTPYQDQIEDWQISVSRTKEDNSFYIEFEAFNGKTNKSITKKGYDHKN